jgi:hypothetical protein
LRSKEGLIRLSDFIPVVHETSMKFSFSYNIEKHFEEI